MSRRPIIATLAAAAALAVPTALAVPGAGATSTRHAAASQATAPYENANLPVRKRVADLLSRMTLQEKIGQMTQAERAERRPERREGHERHARQRAVGRRLGAHPEHARRRGPTWSTPTRRPRWRPGCTSRSSTASTRSTATATCTARPSSRTTSPSARRATRRSCRRSSTSPPRRRARPARSGPSPRASAPPATTAGAARTSASARTRSSSRKMETAIDGFQGKDAKGIDKPDRVLATAKHFAGDGLTTYGTGSNSGQTGNYPIDQGVDQVSHGTFYRLALQPVRAGDPGPQRRLGHAVLLGRRLDRGRPRQPDQHARQQGPDPGLAEGSGGLRRVRDLRLQRDRPHRPDDRRRSPRGSSRASTPASTCSCSPRTSRTSRRRWPPRSTAGQVSMARIDDAVSRILTKKFELGLFEHPYTDRRYLDQVGSRAAPRGRPPGRGEVAGAAASNQRGALPLPNKTTCTWPAPTPTTSATRPAAGR